MSSNGKRAKGGKKLQATVRNADLDKYLENLTPSQYSAFAKRIGLKCDQPRPIVRDIAPGTVSAAEEARLTFAVVFENVFTRLAALFFGDNAQLSYFHKLGLWRLLQGQNVLLNMPAGNGKTVVPRAFWLAVLWLREADCTDFAYAKQGVKGKKGIIKVVPSTVANSAVCNDADADKAGDVVNSDDVMAGGREEVPMDEGGEADAEVAVPFVSIPPDPAKIVVADELSSAEEQNITVIIYGLQSI
jgi:hypothetical protein